MVILYRISENSYKRERFEHATKEYCLSTFTSRVTDPSDELHIFADAMSDAGYTLLADRCSAWMPNAHIHRTYAGSSAASFRIVYEKALEYPDDTVIWFQEDDYLYRIGSDCLNRQLIHEALQRAHYVSLYDHPDKYIPARQGGNPMVGDDGGEVTKVYTTSSSHWKLTNSTTLTFGALCGILREDRDIWMKWTAESHPHDMHAFLELREKGRSLLTPIPSRATHCDVTWAAPLVDWENV